MTTGAAPGVEILERICQENLAVYTASAGRLQEDVSQESQVAEDYRGRLVYELLQNADDAFGGLPNVDDRALFRLTDSELWVANTGRPFTEADVRGLCGLGASSKARPDAPKRASIGHKGLGFKSVLEIADAPEAYSETVSFQLGRDEAWHQVESLWARLDRGEVRAVPAMRFPAALNAPHQYWDDLRRRGFRTAFRFPLKERLTTAQRVKLAEQLLTLPMTSVLFLKHLEDVTIEVETTEVSDDRQWLLERRRITCEGLVPCGSLVESGLFRVDLVNRDGDGDCYWLAHNADVQIGECREGLSGPAWEGVGISEISVAVRSVEDPQIDPETRRFHVFLPTQEPATCSVLINGAFATDLSRRHVQVSDSPFDYNAHLVREAATAFAEVLVPHLIAEGGPEYVLRVLDEKDGNSGSTAELTREALTNALADTPLLPAGGATLSLSQCVLPTPLLGNRGSEFAALLRDGTVVDERRFPDPEYCEGDLAAIAENYGAQALGAADTVVVLAQNGDPQKSLLQLEAEGRFYLDPVLDLCVAIRTRAGWAERAQLQAVAREQPIFPTGENADGTVNRIVLGQQKAFYPPRSSAEDLPLREIQFLAHGICWGTLDRIEQSSALEGQMAAWSALFDIKDFRFDEVMRAAVLPGLTRTGDSNLELQRANRTIETLATICRLAGSTIKPDQPLPMSRLGSDRAYFNLSRLEVPCRSEPGTPTKWLPAYQVYFGRDWIGADSVEEVADAMGSAGHPLDIHYLAHPAVFAAYSSTLGVDSEESTNARIEYDPNDDQVDLDDDTDEVLETTADDRWRNFFAWLGVSRGLRLIHFHDVDDAATGWASTKGLSLPGGWAFSGRGESWSQYRAELQSSLASDARWDSTDHYLYRVHNLDYLDEVVAAARRKDNDVAAKLLTHLVRNWPIYSSHTQAELALVETGKVPSQRAKPPRARTEELAIGCANFWLFRLRQHAICPTSHGPRRPDQTWRRSDELLRRLERGGRDAGMFVPVLKPLEGVSDSLLRACLDELRVRGELTPAAFTIDDAHDLCVRISQLYAGGVSDQALRSELRPIYRQMFELLVRSMPEQPTPLMNTPLAASTSGGVRFLPAHDVVYASVSGSRERSGVQSRIPIFILEAEANATAPLRNIFGTDSLENALVWAVSPGELALDDEEVRRFRAGLDELLAPLLARLSVDRAERGSTDRRLLRQFIATVEPVESLALHCSFRGEDLGDLPPRTYYVQQTDTGPQAFVVWAGDPWPPTAGDAQTLALALAETLEVNSVETFLSFINAKPEQRRQLLDLAGAAERLDDVTHELASDTATEEVADAQITPHTGELAPTDGEPAETEVGQPDRAQKPPSPEAAPRVPLHRFEDLLIDGKVIRILGVGSHTGADDGSDRSGSDGEAGVEPGGAARAAGGTDLNELDRLGMRITFEFERRRFGNLKAVVLPDEESPLDANVLVVDVSSPSMIKAAIEQSEVVRQAFETLAAEGVSELYPGFDVMTVVEGEVDRMIELKSSTGDARTQAMSWNEWKTAGSRRHQFWLYLVGNLRADVNNAPFVRAVQDPFGTLESSTQDDTIRKRTVLLQVREFEAADQLTLTVRAADLDAPDAAG